MADSPGGSSPIDSSFDASDVATPCTVIAAKIGLRNQKNQKEEENEENEEESRDDDEVSAIYVDDYSKGFSEDASSVVIEPPVRPPTFARTITKVYCHVDEQEHPYMVEVHVPPDCITLRDVKRKLMRSNFKYFAIVLDPDTGLEVKAEIRDDDRRLHPLKNGQFELFLLTVEGSVHSDNSSGRHRSSKKSSREHLNDYERAARQFDNGGGSDSEASSLPTYVKKAHAYNRRVGALQAPSYAHHVLNQRHQKASRQHHHHYRNQHQLRPQQNHYEDSTFDATESDDYAGRDGETYYDEDEDDSRSINTDLTSVSQQHMKQRWRQQQKQQQMRNKWKSMSTTSSSFSSITESSMGLQVITVRLNVETMPLGMTPTGHRNARGDAGLYVGAITDRGAVALDGRIDIGDQILSINEIDLSNYSNDEAVQLLREAAQRQYVTLEVAKTGSSGPAVARNPRQEAVRPLDTNEWIKHATHAMKAMPPISEESSSTPIPDEWPSNSSLASGTPFGGGPQHQLTSQSNKKYVVEVMAAPGSGLDIRDHAWMKINIPMSVLGSDLVNWLLDHVKGLKDRKEAKKFASEMLKLGYIQHAVGKESFSENRYYVMGEECADYTQLRAPDGGFKYPQSQGSSSASSATTANNNNNNIFPPSMFQPQQRGSAVLSGAAQGFSMVSGYASMPASPFPGAPRVAAPGAPSGSSGRTHDDQRSQTSGSSRGSSRRYVELPRKTSSQGSGSESSSLMDRVASRSSFRAAMSGSLRQFNIDN